MEKTLNPSTIIIKTMMIDLHTHILPNIDDGASNIQEAVKMTNLLLQQGVDGAVCTPHYYPTQMSIEDFTNRRNKAMGLMKEAKIPLILASETYLHECLLYFSSLEPLKIDNTNYLLLELPFERRRKKSMFSTLESLINRFDIIPIIAHIERYPAIKEKYIKRIKNLGCVIQLNTPSLLDKSLKRKALAYMEKGLIDVLGSDCHNLKHRPPLVQTPLGEIRKQLGDSYCDKLIIQSEKIVQGINIL